MTGGIGFASDMLKRYKANRALIKNSKKWGHSTINAKELSNSISNSNHKVINNDVNNTTNSNKEFNSDLSIDL